MTRFVLGQRQTLLPNWAIASLLAGVVGFTYFYSIRAVSNDDLDQEISRQLQQQVKDKKKKLKLPTLILMFL